MLPDFELIQHSFKGGQDINIIPISDVHLGSPGCMEQEFIAFIDKVAKMDNTYLILNGDLIDNGTKSSVTNPFRATMPPSVQKKEMANILEKVKDKILCILPGNHEARSGKDADDDPCYDIAFRLGIENRYRESIAFLKIQMGAERHDVPAHLRPCYVAVVVHGSGGGILTGGSVNRSERFGYAFDNVDLIISGHTHKPYTTQPGKISVDTRNNIVTIKPFKVVSSTSWLNYGGYAAQKMLLPSTHCLNTITLKGKEKDILVTM